MDFYIWYDMFIGDLDMVTIFPDFCHSGTKKIIILFSIKNTHFWLMNKWNINFHDFLFRFLLNFEANVRALI